MSVTIHLNLEGAFAAIKPKGWLDERFADFRKAIEGAIFNRTRKLNLATLDKVPGIIVRLREADFPVEISRELEERLSEHEVQLWHDVQAAKERARAFDAEMRERGKYLYPFQFTGVTWLAMKHGALLADEMGLGKTLQTLAALPANAAVLVIGPAVAKGVWRREIRAWRPGLRVSVLEGRGNFRWPEKGEVVILNYDILPDCHTPECIARQKMTSRVVKGKHLDDCRDPVDPEACKGCLVLDSKKPAKGKHAPGCKNPERPSACKGCYPSMPGQHGAECLKAQGNVFIPAVQELARRCKGCLSPAETVRDCAGCLPFLKHCPEDIVVVADEAHNIKNVTAQRTVRFRGLGAAARAKNGRIWLLTGTPLMNEPTELWGVLQGAMMAQEVFGDFKKFVSLFNGKSLEHGGFAFGTPETEEVAERIQRVMLRRLRTEVMPELPAKRVEFRPVDVSSKALHECDEFMKTHGGIARIVKELGKALKFETMSKIRAALATAKIPAMTEIVETFEEQDEPLIVFSSYRAPIDSLKRRPGWAVITGDTSNEERSRIEESFQAGDLKGLGCTIRAGGVAMTLTRACNELFVDQEWNPALNSQAQDRICRIGQTRPCLITVLVAEHPLDERIEELLTRKQEMIDASVDAARDIPAGVQAT